MNKRDILNKILTGEITRSQARGALRRLQYTAPGLGLGVHHGPGPVPPEYLVEVQRLDGTREALTLAEHEEVFPGVPPIIFTDFSNPKHISNEHEKQ